MAQPSWRAKEALAKAWGNILHQHAAVIIHSPDRLTQVSDHFSQLKSMSPKQLSR